MSIYAKCHGPNDIRFCNGAAFEVVGESDAGIFSIELDDNTVIYDAWNSPAYAQRWERIERTDANILKQCTHLTEAVWEDPDTDECIRISVDDDGDVTVKEPNRDFKHISAPLLAAINEAVARHKAANADTPTRV